MLFFKLLMIDIRRWWGSVFGGLVARNELAVYITVVFIIPALLLILIFRTKESLLWGAGSICMGSASLAAVWAFYSLQDPATDRETVLIRLGQVLGAGTAIAAIPALIEALLSKGINESIVFFYILIGTVTFACVLGAGGIALAFKYRSSLLKSDFRRILLWNLSPAWFGIPAAIAIGIIAAIYSAG